MISIAIRLDDGSVHCAQAQHNRPELTQYLRTVWKTVDQWDSTHSTAEQEVRDHQEEMARAAEARVAFLETHGELPK